MIPKLKFEVVDNPEGFIIKDKEFNQVQNMLFDNLWTIAKK